MLLLSQPLDSSHMLREFNTLISGRHIYIYIYMLHTHVHVKAYTDRPCSDSVHSPRPQFWLH